MRIAQVAPLHESVPPKTYGGTERVVHFLTEELVALGHDVTLYASGDSRTSARLVAPVPHALRLNGCGDPLPPHVALLSLVADQAGAYDVVHFHTGYLHFPLTRARSFAHLTTFHDRLDLPELEPLQRELGPVPVVSISDHQRRPWPGADWRATIHHGLPTDLLRYHSEGGDYVAFLGRLSREKRCDRAIEIARAAGLPLRMAAKIDDADREFFAREVEPRLGDGVEFVGEIGEHEKEEFLGNARALVFPIDWPEPFGLVMIEALACGTPVVAYRHGSVPEVIEDGVTGFVVADRHEAARALGRIGEISRRRCREEFERRFSARRMALDYLSVYERLAGWRAA